MKKNFLKKIKNLILGKKETQDIIENVEEFTNLTATYNKLLKQQIKLRLDSIAHRQLGGSLPWLEVVHEFVVGVLRRKRLRAGGHGRRELEVLGVVHGVHRGRQVAHVPVEGHSRLTRWDVLPPSGQRPNRDLPLDRH